MQDIVRVDDKEGWYEVKIGQTEMLSSALCIYLHPRGLEIPIISSHTATNRSMSDQHKLIQPMSEIWISDISYILTLASYHTRSMPIFVFLFSSPTKERCKQAVENCKVLYDNFFSR